MAVTLPKCRGGNGRFWWLQHRTENAATFCSASRHSATRSLSGEEKFGIKYLMRVFDGFGDSDSIEFRAPVVVSSRGTHVGVACTVG